MTKRISNYLHDPLRQSNLAAGWQPPGTQDVAGKANREPPGGEARVESRPGERLAPGSPAWVGLTVVPAAAEEARRGRGGPRRGESTRQAMLLRHGFRLAPQDESTLAGRVAMTQTTALLSCLT